MAVTEKPHDCNNRPMDEIVTPFPKPETTPPVTIMYFILTRVAVMESCVLDDSVINSNAAALGWS